MFHYHNRAEESTIKDGIVGIFKKNLELRDSGI
jgi:hypothetical protein